jgi:p-aminobenzoyl-glutamate transporter AbgT
MELDDLKYIWQEETSSLASRVSSPQIRAMLQRRSQGALSKINRSILLEVVLLFVIGGTSLYWMVETGVKTWFIGGFGLFLLSSFGFYAYKYRSLNQELLEPGNLYETLRHTTGRMGQFMRFYFYFSLIIPLLSSGGLIFGFLEGLKEAGSSLEEISLEGWLVLMGVMFAYGALSFWFVRWYIRRLYGRHYQVLLSCLEELKEISAPNGDLV